MSSLIAAAAALLVFCAPGYPGTSGDAQPLVGDFANTLATAAGWPAGSLSAVYDANEQSDLQRLAAPDASLAFVPYPFFLAHGAALHLLPLVQADVSPAGVEQQWTLVMQKGHPAPPAGLAGITLISTAGYAPGFIRYALQGLGSLPPNMTVSSTGQVLSALRRTANGDPVAVLLDQEQAAALASLPFAAQLQAVAKSPVVPVALIVTVDNRLPQPRAEALKKALLHLSDSAAGKATLSRLRLNGFVAAKSGLLPATP